MEPSHAWAPLAEALLGTAEFTTLEVAREAGVDLAQARRLWRALGFPPVAGDERLFTRSDIEILRSVRALIDLQSADPDDLLQLTRVVGQSLARVADAQVTAVAGRLERQRVEAAPGEIALAELVGRIEALAPSLEQFLGYVWRRHLVAALRRLSAQPSVADRTLTIGFADLVGFTAMSQALDAPELAAMVDRFEAIAYEHIPERGGRVVKMIGDEVMFAVDDGAFAADIAVALVEALARDADLPDVRVGLASGPTLSWEGDLFGPTVNLASRLVNFARPSSVLVSDELGEQLRDDPRFELQHLRPVKLQGIGRVRPWVLRRARVA
jgi:adenylate cyclase